MEPNRQPGLDAYATGGALGTPRIRNRVLTPPAVEGHDYLLRTQEQTGEWHVDESLAFQPYFQSGFPTTTPMDLYNAMATIALTFAAQ
jgi:hypothetical protein